jgi:hypothetical protein
LRPASGYTGYKPWFSHTEIIDEFCLHGRHAGFMVQNEFWSIGMVSIELLSRSHRPLLKEFRNQHESLVEHLRRYALRHAEKDHLSKTHVAIDMSSGTRRLAGYFSLTTTSVDRDSVTGMDALARLPRYPIPAILLASGR